MTASTRTAGGQFAPGASGNLRGRPSTARRLIEAELIRLGASQQEVDAIVAAAGDPARSAVAIAVLVAAVSLQNTPTSALTHAEVSPAR